jgi:DNA-binding NarL/FixJ family response regulator
MSAAVEKGVRRVLLVDLSSTAQPLMVSCVLRTWPSAQIEVCSSAGQQLAADVTRYDFVLMEYRAGSDENSGLRYLAATRRQGRDAPPVVLLTEDETAQTASRARELGVECWMYIDEVSPRRFRQCVAQIRTKGTARSAAAESNTEIWRQAQRSSALPQSGPSPQGPGIGESSARSASGSRQAGGPKTNNLPGYQILGELAKGGMTRILLADRLEDGLRVALKIMPVEQEADGELLRRFMREYSLIAKLSHPNVIRIHERGFAADFAYIAMDYYPRGDLRQRIRGPISPRTAFDYLFQIADGLGAAHSQGIVHRDIKPGNILFRDDATLAVTDFGIAKDLVSDQRLTQDRILLGTAHYMSPEQINAGEVDAQSDLYSVGAVLFHMLTGAPPYRAETPWDVMQAHVSAPIPRLPEAITACQPLIDGLLAKDPADRFLSTQELKEGLDWVLRKAS